MIQRAGRRHIDEPLDLADLSRRVDLTAGLLAEATHPAPSPARAITPARVPH